jgi:glutathione S-transferase
VGKVRLYMIPGSDAVVSARLMLDHKGVPYEHVRLPPGAHAFIMLALGFQSMSVPAITIEGRRVQGSRWISRALDERFAGRPLFPADPRRRREVEDAERWGELFNDATRRLFYCAARRDLDAFRTVMTVGHGRCLRFAARMTAPLVVRLAAGAHHAADSTGLEDLALLPERLSQIDAWIDRGVLNGEELNAADFQIAPNVASLLLSEDLWPYVVGRPAEALARRVLPCAPGPRIRLAPREWLVADAVAAPARVGATAIGWRRGLREDDGGDEPCRRRG